jgi:surface antigen
MAGRNLISVIAACLALQGCVAGGLGQSGSLSPSPQEEARLLLAALKGGLVAGELGAGLGETARLKAVAAEYRALESPFGAAPAQWSDERSGAVGEVTAAVPYRVGSQDCRAYTHVVTQKGVRRSASGSACRQADASWLRLD